MMEGTRNAIMFPKKAFSQFIADDGDVALKLSYVGSQASATVEVSAAGDILFKHGVAGAEAADSTIQIGSAAGTIDVSNAAGNTFGEVVDHINRSGNWKAYLVGALRADSSDASTGSLLAMSAKTISPLKASSPLGVSTQEISLYKDTSKVLNMSIRVGVRSNVSGSEEKGAGEVYQIVSTNTFSSGTSKIQIYEIDEAAKTETKRYETAGGATTVENTKQFVQNGRGAFAVTGVGKHLLVRMIGSAACTGNIMVLGATDCGN